MADLYIVDRFICMQVLRNQGALSWTLNWGASMMSWYACAGSLDALLYAVYCIEEYGHLGVGFEVLMERQILWTSR